jgi:rhodanese-related sulfurtransferase
MPDPVGADQLLALARRGLNRLTPVEVAARMQAGALVVDTRTDRHRAEQGEFPDAVVIDRTVLEWRLDPLGAWRIPEATGFDLEVVLVCRHGFSSSLAADSLRRMGLSRATDMVGGVEAWIAAGLPMSSGPADVRR